MYSYKEIEKQNNDLFKYKIDSKTIGAFIRGGSIIPLKERLRRSTKRMKDEPYTLIIALNNDQKATGLVYFDDEESFNFEEKEQFALKKIVYQYNEIFIASLHDNYGSSSYVEKIVILGFSKNEDEILSIVYQVIWFIFKFYLEF